jgi:hypothetical protein
MVEVKSKELDADGGDRFVTVEVGGAGLIPVIVW